MAKCIVLGDTLLENFTADEIEIILAHELGHHVHKDVPLGILVQSVIMLRGFWLAELLMVALAIFGLVAMPLSNGWSRWREVKADRYRHQAVEVGGVFVAQPSLD